MEQHAITIMRTIAICTLITLLGPAPANAMSFVHDCSAALGELHDGIAKDNSCQSAADCTMVAQPPCGCESLAINTENADAAASAMRICTAEGVVCETCALPPASKSPKIGCIENHCKLIK